MICCSVITNKLSNLPKKTQTLKLKSAKGICKILLWLSETKAKRFPKAKTFCPSSKVVASAMRRMSILEKLIQSGWSAETVMQSFIFLVWEEDKYAHFAPLRSLLQLENPSQHGTCLLFEFFLKIVISGTKSMKKTKKK